MELCERVRADRPHSAWSETVRSKHRSTPPADAALAPGGSYALTGRHGALKNLEMDSIRAQLTKAKHGDPEAQMLLAEDARVVIASKTKKLQLADREDVEQSTLAAMLTKLPTFLIDTQDDAHLSRKWGRWVGVIATRKVNTKLRKLLKPRKRAKLGAEPNSKETDSKGEARNRPSERQKVREAQLPAEEHLPNGKSGVGTRLGRKEHALMLASKVTEHLEKLPGDQKRVFELRAEGRSYEDIRVEIGAKSVAAVKASSRQAIAALRPVMKKWTRNE